jgi:hypothetical protein
MLHCANELLTEPLEHAHDTSGYNLSIVTEVSAHVVNTATAVATDQPALPWSQAIPSWCPDQMFRGNNGKRFRYTPGCKGKLAVSLLAGPPGRRGQLRPHMTLNSARAKADAMTDDEIAAAASLQGQIAGAAGN